MCSPGGNASVTGGENQPEGAGGWWGTRWERDSSTPLRFAQNDMWGVCLARDEIGLREDGSPHSRGQEGGEVCDWHGRDGCGLREDGSPHSRGQEGGEVCDWHGRDGCGLREDGSPHSRGQEGVPPPSPVFARAGFNLPPSRGKGLVGADGLFFSNDIRRWATQERLASLLAGGEVEGREVVGFHVLQAVRDATG